jgi:hypothetical protein
VLKKLQIAGSTYSPYNINVFNELFYRYARYELINELPNLFTELEMFNIALHKKITTEANSNVIIKVMELAVGTKMDRWETFMKIDQKHKWRILLTDFSKNLLPNPNTINNTDNFKFITGIYSLFDNFPKLKPSDMHDCLLSTYTFDNLWLEDDLHLTKINNAWYKERYRLDLSKTEKGMKDIKKGKKLDRQFFMSLRIKTRRTKINISFLKHGAYINEYYKNYKHVSVNYPGGLIATVVNSYHNQLKKEGIFITADIATAAKNKITKGFESINETVKIKIENYALAKYILEKLGYYVVLKNLHEFIKEAGIVTPVKIHDHFVLLAQLSS